ncbi:MAG: T9SS type A sorting domain-containing protein [Bacteroidales bacterium]
MQGYVKNGDTIGIILPDSLLTVGLESQVYNETSNHSVFPNPADEIITIKNLNPIEDKSFDIEIRNLQGVLIREEKNIISKEFKMDVSDLPGGLYLYTIKENNSIIQQGKLIIK